MMSASDILLTTIHVINDWPISDQMNRDLTQRAPDRGAAHSQGARTGREAGGCFINGHLLLHCSLLAVYIQTDRG
ncbi:unnamed protein product, partial [Staurois parvus]